MKRHGNLFDKVCSMQNLILADKNARKGKSAQYGIKEFDKQRGCNFILLHNMLMDGSYETGKYRHKIIREPKVREISILSYFPHRLVHHAGMNVLEGIFVPTFTADSYSCIKGKGIHAATVKIKNVLLDVENTRYCLKMDVRKFYPNVDHEVLKLIIRRKIKDASMLTLIDGVIDSAPGLPIGNYFSQYFANLYLNGLDHLLKEQLSVKYYFRYLDDMIILHHSKPYLHALRFKIKTYLLSQLKLEMKDNYRVFPVVTGMDILGTVFYPTHTRLRKSIKQNMARKYAKGIAPSSEAGFKGWTDSCDCRHLMKKLNGGTTNKNICRTGDTINQYPLCG